jgi:hypothetical protein
MRGRFRSLAEAVRFRCEVIDLQTGHTSVMPDYRLRVDFGALFSGACLAPPRNGFGKAFIQAVRRTKPDLIRQPADHSRQATRGGERRGAHT